MVCQGRSANPYDPFCKPVLASHFTCLETGSERAEVLGHPQQPGLGNFASCYLTRPDSRTDGRSRPALCLLPYLLFSQLPLSRQPLPLALLPPVPLPVPQLCRCCLLLPPPPRLPVSVGLLSVISPEGWGVGLRGGWSRGRLACQVPRVPLQPPFLPHQGHGRPSAFTFPHTHKGCPLCAGERACTQAQLHKGVHTAPSAHTHSSSARAHGVHTAPAHSRVHTRARTSTPV